MVKRFGATVALDGVDLILDEGEVRGLLGPNGAGKTTLLRILLGLVRADAGSVELFDRPVRTGDPDGLAGVAGFVEDPSFYPYLSGRANLELLAELDGDGALARVDDALAQVGLTVRAKDRVSGYSTGMKQRLGIAACLIRGPRLLLLDEPSAGLDPGGVRDMEGLIRELTADGVAVLVSSHQISEVEGVCDGFTMLRHGRVVWDGSIALLRAQAPASAHRMATSDDAAALSLAERSTGVRVRRSADGELLVSAERGALDPYVVGLGRAGVAVRRLELETSPLESMFFSLTGDHDIGTPPPVEDAPATAPPSAAT